MRRRRPIVAGCLILIVLSCLWRFVNASSYGECDALLYGAVNKYAEAEHRLPSSVSDLRDSAGGEFWAVERTHPEFQRIDEAKSYLSYESPRFLWVSRDRVTLVLGQDGRVSFQKT